MTASAGTWPPRRSGRAQRVIEDGLGERERVVVNGQRRAERQDRAAADLEAQAAFKGCLEHPVGTRGVVELDAEEGADMPDIPDMRMALAQCLEPGAPLLADGAGPHDEAVPVEGLDGGEAGGAAVRALLVRVVAERHVARDVQVPADDERRLGTMPPPRPLPRATMSGTQSNASWTKKVLQRPSAEGISSKISSAPWRSQLARTFAQKPGGGGSTVVQRTGSAWTAATSPCTSST